MRSTVSISKFFPLYLSTHTICTQYSAYIKFSVHGIICLSFCPIQSVHSANKSFPPTLIQIYTKHIYIAEGISEASSAPATWGLSTDISNCEFTRLLLSVAEKEPLGCSSQQGPIIPLLGEISIQIYTSPAIGLKDMVNFQVLKDNRQMQAPQCSFSRLCCLQFRADRESPEGAFPQSFLLHFYQFVIYSTPLQMACQPSRQQIQ